MTETRGYLNYLEEVANEDVAHLKMKEKTYGNSWKKRGGVGAFMMLARKWDRLENIVTQHFDKYDVFSVVNEDLSGTGSD